MCGVITQSIFSLTPNFLKRTAYFAEATKAIESPRSIELLRRDFVYGVEGIAMQ